MAPHRTAIPISRSVTLEMAVDPWYTVSIVPDSGPREMLVTCQASAATGQMGPPNASWWTTTPHDPFFVCAMQIVALSAVRRFVNPLECWRMTPLCHSLMLHSWSGMVCFAQYVAGEVYSPTRRR
jgi:hypothetical protein